ncbi:ABC transporter ATP-binding protein [Nocardiopsis changdeensis]|uniref:ABC transporter ATP-binding protein n=1 Tax=Nocardiopsis changdeensis TaxID=2831969 RepID=A0ABX8BVQ8_9ACTN|nr:MULTISPECIES: ABC transporter ATP-binding protein [Nocardiopsis]QUX25289.1 ABC transporter ATP-binding protein [Nocardiopsis changdeensis]QYX35676.1 ABC transporter ATP-binding protein/permease [Nocardiopsis sp. MT53]
MTAATGPAPPAAGLATWPGMWAALAGHRGVYLAAVAFNTLALLAQAGAALGGVWAVVTVLAGGGPADLAAPAAATLAAVAVRSAASWLESWLSHDLSFRVLARVRLWVYDALARLAPAGLSRRRSGDLLTSSLSDAEALEIFYAHSSIYTLSAWAATPLLWGALAAVSPPAALLTAPVLALSVALTLAARRWARPQGERIRTALAELGGEVAENTGAVREIVGYGLVPRRAERLAALDDRLLTAQFRNARRSGAETAVLGAVALLAAVATAAAAAWQLERGTLAPEAVPFAIVLATMATAPVLQWAAMTRHYGTTGEAAARIGALLTARPPVAAHGDLAAPPEEGGRVRAEGVTFRWSDVDAQASARPAVRDLTVRVRPGEHIAIAGRSGSGKSTFAQVLARCVDPGQGRVEAAGAPLPGYTRPALPGVVSLLPQDVALFRETVRDNLLLATDDDLGDADLWRVLEAARVDDVVRRLPQGLDTVLADNGRSLSGGERQRLALARTLLKPARVLVLDEAVSQLDAVGEHDVQEAIAAARAGRTTITIAHRLTTLVRAERIIVLDAGVPVGDGAHADLLRDCPAYRRLVAPQLDAPG